MLRPHVLDSGGFGADGTLAWRLAPGSLTTESAGTSTGKPSRSIVTISGSTSASSPSSSTVEVVVVSALTDSSAAASSSDAMEVVVDSVASCPSSDSMEVVVESVSEAASAATVVVDSESVVSESVDPSGIVVPGTVVSDAAASPSVGSEVVVSVTSPSPYALSGMMASVVITRSPDNTMIRSRLPTPFRCSIQPVLKFLVLNIRYLHSSVRAASTALRPEYLAQGTTWVDVASSVSGTQSAYQPSPRQSSVHIVSNMWVECKGFSCFASSCWISRP